MAGKTIALRVLHLDDNPGGRARLKELLGRNGLDCSFRYAETRDELVQALDDGNLDLVVADHETSAFSGIAALELVRERDEHLPFIFVGTRISEPAAIEAFEKGATDYILTDRPSRLVPSVLRALRDAQRAKELIDSVRQRRELEEKFLRAQRMESIGILSGGIAHDLNNVLAPILLGAQLLRGSNKDPMSLGVLEAIETAATHGGELIKQILAFSRGASGKPVEVELAELIRNTQKLLAQTFPKSITLQTELSSDLWPFKAVPTQLSQVLMNLCINARDAMPEGGVLRISAANETIEAEDSRLPPGTLPGAFVCLTVADTGTGISPENVEKLFLPFFTTKAPDKGTGLGLSSVRTILQNHGGFIEVSTELGTGTSFKTYIPAALGPPVPMAPRPAGAFRGNGEVILVVDDEPEVLRALRLILETNGFLVVTAESGKEALSYFRERRNDLCLVLTDIMMPGMDGFGLIHALRKEDPELRIVVLTGFREQGRLSELAASRHIETLAKPFNTQKVLGAVERALLDKRPNP